MNNLFEAWRTARPPFYDKRYKDLLMKEFTDYGARTSDIKAFDTAYEFYIYAFFVGLYYNEKRKISHNENSYGYKIENWGTKGTRKDRKDFSILQKYMFIAAFTKTDIDYIALEKGEISEEAAVNKLMETIELYANGGMNLIREKFEDNESYFFTPTGFLDFLLLSEQKILV